MWVTDLVSDQRAAAQVWVLKMGAARTRGDGIAVRFLVSPHIKCMELSTRAIVRRRAHTHARVGGWRESS